MPYLSFAAHSIVETGNGDYKLKPVIHATLYQADLYWGSINGVIMPTSCGGVIWAIDGTDSTSTYANANGQFQIQYLDPGVYTVVVDADASCSDTTFTISVGAGANSVDTLWLD